MKEMRGNLEAGTRWRQVKAKLSTAPLAVAELLSINAIVAKKYESERGRGKEGRIGIQSCKKRSKVEVDNVY